MKAARVHCFKRASELPIKASVIDVIEIGAEEAGVEITEQQIGIGHDRLALDRAAAEKALSQVARSPFDSII
jgi:hypothetical protein